MPKMPESDSKEETAESIAEKKEQVCTYILELILPDEHWNFSTRKG